MKIDTLEAIFYTVLTSLLMSIGELTVFYLKISKDISKQINNSLKKICDNEEKINNILTKKLKKMPASEILKIKEVQNKIQETNPTIFKNIHNAIEKPYVKLGNQLNYLSAGIIISVIILIIVVLYYKIKAKMTKFNKINFVFFWLSFFLIAGYQAFFTLKIALAPGVYQYADFVEEILPMLIYE
tara:strand:- start:193 stop:747 length:555 start_codon:yes stop_codon:yes gene_type:complete